MYLIYTHCIYMYIYIYTHTHCLITNLYIHSVNLFLYLSPLDVNISHGFKISDPEIS